MVETSGSPSSASSAWATACRGIRTPTVFFPGCCSLRGTSAVALAIALTRWPRARNRTAAGLLSGLGLVPLFVAYLNRGGPGTVCVSTATSQSCTQEWSPWPWAGAGLALVTAGFVIFLMLRRREAR